MNMGNSNNNNNMHTVQYINSSKYNNNKNVSSSSIIVCIYMYTQNKPSYCCGYNIKSYLPLRQHKRQSN